MASDALKEQLKNLSGAITGIDEDKLLRKSLGELSLERDFVPKLKDIKKKVALLVQYANELHDEQLQTIVGELENIRTEMEQQASFSSQDYATNRDHFLSTIETYLGRIRPHWSPVVATVIEARGLLDDEGIRQEHEHTIESIKQESESALQQVKEEANKTIEEARALAKEIEDRARFTATGISVEEAQKQFREAQTALDKRVKIWAILGIISIVGFIVAALYFLNTDLPDQWRWQVVYHSSIRVSTSYRDWHRGGFLSENTSCSHAHEREEQTSTACCKQHGSFCAVSRHTRAERFDIGPTCGIDRAVWQFWLGSARRRSHISAPR